MTNTRLSILTNSKRSSMASRRNQFMAACAGLLCSGLIVSACGSEPNEDLTPVSSAVVGTTEPAPGQILVCVDANYGGVCQLMGTGFWPFTAGVPNDSMSSLKVGSNVRVSLCRDGTFGGTCETLPAGARIANLGSEPVGNDSVSSVRIVDATVPDCRFGANPPVGWVFLFRDANYGNDCTSLQAGFYPTPAEFGLANDSISSLKTALSTPGGQPLAVSPFGDINFGGLKKFGGGFVGSVSYVGDFNDIISSLSVGP
jgi:hypothetical protein